MKNLTVIPLVAVLFSLAGLACKNPLTAYTKQYKCEVAGFPEPETSDDYVKRAYKHYQDNDYKNDPGDCALGACAEAARLDPKNGDAFYCRAQMYRDKKDWEKAIADADEAIRLKPDKGHFYGLRGVLYGDKEMWEKGLADLNKQIELLGSEATHYDYDRRGDFYSELHKYEEAVKDYTEAIRLSPDYRYYYSDRARAYDSLGKKDLADVDNQKFNELELADKNKDSGPAPGGNIKTGDSRTIAGGVLNDKATSLPAPPYPPAARAVRAAGKVVVNIEVDTNGAVVKAEAASGHPLLRAAAVAAARQAKFKAGPSPVSGSLEYEFKQE